MNYTEVLETNDYFINITVNIYIYEPVRLEID